LQLQWSTWSCWWGMFYQIEKEGTRQQSTVIKKYVLLAIMVLLRLVPRVLNKTLPQVPSYECTPDTPVIL
jgi:hypothetical protein